MKHGDFDRLIDHRRKRIEEMLEGIRPLVTNGPTAFAILAVAAPLAFACTEILAQAIYACRPLERDP